MTLSWLILIDFLNEKVAKCVASFDPHDFSLQIVGRGEGRQVARAWICLRALCMADFCTSYDLNASHI